MAGPVLVKPYSTTTPSSKRPPNRPSRPQALPPISSYAFADILKAADCPAVQQALDGIAEICAKNRMSLADEYGAHLPPLGEITAVSNNPAVIKPHLIRPGLRPALTSVPEGSSGSSEESRRSRKKRGPGLFAFGWRGGAAGLPLGTVRIGRMGRVVVVETTTALAADLGSPSSGDVGDETRPQRGRAESAAAASLQRLLEAG